MMQNRDDLNLSPRPTCFHRGGRSETITSVRKNNLSEVPLAVFGREEFSWLSAVIFSSCASWGKVRALSFDPNPNIFFEAVRLNAGGVMPHVVRARKSAFSESLLDGLRVYQNPSATQKLDVSAFRHPDVFQSYYSEKDDEWMHDQPDGFRIVRVDVAGPLKEKMLEGFPEQPYWDVAGGIPGLEIESLARHDSAHRLRREE